MLEEIIYAIDDPIARAVVTSASSIVYYGVFYFIPVSVVLSRTWTGDIHDKLELTILLVSTLVMSFSIYLRLSSFRKLSSFRYTCYKGGITGEIRINSSDEEIHKYYSYILALICALSVLLFLPWTNFYPPSLAEFIHLDDTNSIIIVVFSVIQAFYILNIELIQCTLHIFVKLDYISKIITKTNPDGLTSTVDLTNTHMEKPLEDVEADARNAKALNATRIVFDEEKRSKVIEYLNGDMDLKPLSRFLHRQGLLYFVDLSVSATAMLYLLYNRLPFSLLTIQLTTMSALPAAVATFNMVFFNSLVRTIEDNNNIKTYLKIGFGFRGPYFGVEKFCGFDVKDMFYYVADWRLFTIVIGQAVIYIFKNFESKIFE